MTGPARRHVMFVFGTRPEAVKMAPLVRAASAEGRFAPVVVVTAQHRGMLDQVLDVFGIVPDVDLDILKVGQTLTDVTTRILVGLEPVLARQHPDVVVVQGDTTTAFAGALASFYARIPIAHVEAGLRSGDIRAPYPEEMNRRLVTTLTTLHLAPTSGARSNLLAEGVAPASVVVTGNTVIDALRLAVGRAGEFTSPGLRELDSDGRRVLLVTAHRRESWGEPLREVARALRSIAEAEPGVLVVFPIHRNQIVRDAILPSVEGVPNVRLVEPVAYGEFTRLIERSAIILTDSGGLQEEGPSLGKPVLVMRSVTERPEGIAAGGARLVGTEHDVIVDAVLTLLRDDAAYRRMASAVNPYGDGHAAARSMAALAMLLDGGPSPDEFRPRAP